MYENNTQLGDCFVSSERCAYNSWIIMLRERERERVRVNDEEKNKSIIILLESCK